MCTLRHVEFWDLKDTKTGKVLAWIAARPAHCDRGRYYANVEAEHWKSESDPWPRYYFRLDYAKEEVVAYCAAKKIDTSAAEWVDVTEEP